MNYLATFIGAALVAALFSFTALFLMWVLVMGFLRARDAGQLKQSVIYFAYLVLGVGYLVDAWCNLLATVIFLEWPRELTVSQRLRRLVMTTGWRARLATWFAVTLINPFSVDGPHIQLPTVEAKA